MLCVTFGSSQTHIQSHVHIPCCRKAWGLTEHGLRGTPDGGSRLKTMKTVTTATPLQPNEGGGRGWGQRSYALQKKSGNFPLSGPTSIVRE